jgi:hypothetical protein
MASYLPSHAAPGRPSDMQNVIEMFVQIIYHDLILPLNPGLALLPDFLQRPKSLHLGSVRRLVTHEFVEDRRHKFQALKNRYNARGNSFYSEAITTCLNVAMLVGKLENMRDFEEDVRMRLEQRLGGVRLVYKWDQGEETWV